LRIVYTSGNSLELFGLTPASILEQTLPELLGIEAVNSVQNGLKDEQYLPNNVLLMNFAIAGAARFDVVAHHTGNFLCVELELAAEEIRSDSLATRMEGAIRELGRPKTVDGLCSVFAPLVRTLTGYDRVMVYRSILTGMERSLQRTRLPRWSPTWGCTTRQRTYRSKPESFI